jgi:hypothetical protein
LPIMNKEEGMKMGGFVGYIQYAIDGERIPDTPFIIRVVEELGSTAEILTVWDGSKTIARCGMTVFATEEEAREDALRRINEAESRWTATTVSLPEENSTRLAFTDDERFFKGHFRKGRFLAETPPDAQTGTSVTWQPEGITRWRRMENDELY